MGEWLLSRRDSTIVARHEVPGIRAVALETSAKIVTAKAVASLCHLGCFATNHTV
jgi:hypothetical protein